MKNRILKGAHLSERKCREIVHLFCEDLTATQIAAITGVSRVTINAYVRMIRTRLALFCDASYPAECLPGNFVRMTNSVDGLPTTAYYGFTRWNGMVLSTGLNELSKDSLVSWQKNYPSEESSNMESIHAVADLSSWRLYRRFNGGPSAGKPGIDEIANLWGLARHRLMKFRGLNRSTLYLHIKECEFRYNYRNENITDKLLHLIRQNPLHELHGTV